MHESSSIGRGYAVLVTPGCSTTCGLLLLLPLLSLCVMLPLLMVLCSPLLMATVSATQQHCMPWIEPHIMQGMHAGRLSQICKCTPCKLHPQALVPAAECRLCCSLREARLGQCLTNPYILLCVLSAAPQWKVAPALAAGNSCVLKPSEMASVTCLELAELAAQAGLPPGVLNVVTGLGPDAGAPLRWGGGFTGRRIGKGFGMLLYMVLLLPSW